MPLRPEDVPSDPARLVAMVLALDTENERLRAIVRTLKDLLFGARSGFTHEGLQSYSGVNFREIAAPGPCFAPRKGRPQSRLQAYRRDKQD